MNRHRDHARQAVLGSNMDFSRWWKAKQKAGRTDRQIADEAFESLFRPFIVEKRKIRHDGKTRRDLRPNRRQPSPDAMQCKGHSSHAERMRRARALYSLFDLPFRLQDAD